MKASGHVEPGYDSVRAAFETNFSEHGDVGATSTLIGAVRHATAQGP